MAGAFNSLTIESLYSPIATTSNAIEYMREATFVNNAAEVAEGAAKPESDVTFSLVNTPVATVAHWIRITRQLAMDNAALVAYVDGRLRYGVNRRIETQLVSGNGTAPNLSGFMRAGSFTAHGYAAAALGATLPKFVLIRKIIADLWAAGYPADGGAIVMNPLDWAQMEIDAMRNPVAEPVAPGYTPMSPEEVAQLGLPPGVYQRGPDGKIDTIEKTQGTTEDGRYQAVGGQIWDMKPDGGGAPTLVGGGSEEVIYGPDGQPIVTRGPAGSSKPFTEGQSKDVVYATRAQGALDALDPVAEALTSRGDVAKGYVPFGLGADYQNPDYQIAETAGNEFLQAILRKDTGAAITPAEQSLYGETYLPRPGDGPERLAYKAEARKRAITAIKAGMSPAQIVAQENALSGGTPPPAAPPAADADGWTIVNGLKVRVKP